MPDDTCTSLNSSSSTSRRSVRKSLTSLFASITLAFFRKSDWASRSNPSILVVPVDTSSLSATHRVTPDKVPDIFSHLANAPIIEILPQYLPPSPLEANFKPGSESTRGERRSSRAPIHRKRELLCKIISREVELPEHVMSEIFEIVSNVVPGLPYARGSIWVDIDDLSMDVIDQLYSLLVGQRI